MHNTLRRQLPLVTLWPNGDAAKFPVGVKHKYTAWCALLEALAAERWSSLLGPSARAYKTNQFAVKPIEHRPALQRGIDALSPSLAGANNPLPYKSSPHEFLTKLDLRRSTCLPTDTFDSWVGRYYWCYALNILCVKGLAESILCELALRIVNTAAACLVYMFLKILNSHLFFFLQRAAFECGWCDHAYFGSSKLHSIGTKQVFWLFQRAKIVATRNNSIIYGLSLVHIR